MVKKLIASGASNADAHLWGAERMLNLAWDELSEDQRIRLNALFASGTSSDEQVTAILAEDPTLKLGDPALIDTGPRDAADAANIRRLVFKCDRVFTSISAGSRDGDIRDVFGALNVDLAKSRYAKAQVWMHMLEMRGRIVTDRSGYSGEVGLGGLTGFQALISLAPEVIDTPDSADSITTMIHESMHAGNEEIIDLGYINRRDEFPKQSEAEKLNNAAHYEVPVWRQLAPSHVNAYRGVTFVPAGAVGEPGARTPREQAIRAASEQLRAAWTLALNLHTIWVQIHLDPDSWTDDLSTRYGAALSGHSYADTMRYWSEWEGLTVHMRDQIDPASPDVSRTPVTRIDVAISEGVVRKLNQAKDAVPADATDAAALELRADPGEALAVDATVEDERDLLIRLVLRSTTGRISGGDEDRDLKFVRELAANGGDWTSIFLGAPVVVI